MPPFTVLPRRVLLAGFVLVAALTTVAALPRAAHAGTVPPPPSGWRTVFSDDFSGAAGAPPSSANWFYDIGTNYGTGEIEQTTNSTANVHLDGDGHLDLTAIDSGGTWTSARIETTRDDFEAPAGGQLEMTASVQQPDPADGLGYWPAFWALGSPMRAGGGWPGSGEIDMMEDVNGLNEASQTLHDSAGSSGHALQSCPGAGSTCQTGYHTYSVIINRQNTSAEFLQFLMDGTVESTITESSVGTSAWQQAVDHGFFIILDLAMGGNYPDGVCGCTAPSPATSSGATMSLAYVAVYEQGGDSTPVATPTGSGTITGVNGHCLANAGALNTEGNPMVAANCDGDAGQQWTSYSDSTLRTEGGCLDVVSAGTTSGTRTDWYPCNGTNAQVWTHQSNGELVNPNSGLCLTDPNGATGTQLQIQTCTDAADQQWTLPTSTSIGGLTVTASDYTAANSVGTEPTTDTGGGSDVGWINGSSWLEYRNVAFGTGLTQARARIASALSGSDLGTVQLRLDSLTAIPFATFPVSGTGGWQNWVAAGPVPASPAPGGTHTLYVTFATNLDQNFVNVNWFSFG